MRICSFLPSATEIIYALGLGENLYGVSHECDFPAEALLKTRVVRSRFDSSQLSSADIDKTVSDFASRGQQIYEIDVKALSDAKPDLVITQELCDVCAVSLDDVREALAEADIRAEILSLDPRSMSDVFQNILQVAERTETEDRGKDYVHELTERVKVVKSSKLPDSARPTVACIEWFDPLITAGHWIPEMVSIAGGVDILTKPSDPSLRVSFQSLIDGSPDIIILMPCGMDVETAQSEFDNLNNTSLWLELTAFTNHRVYVVDSNSLYSRSGPRLVDGLEIFRQLFYSNNGSGVPSSLAQHLNY